MDRRHGAQGLRVLAWPFPVGSLGGMRGRAGPVKAITDRIAIHLESRPAALQFAAAIDRWPTDAPDVPHAERHERASRLLAYAHTSRDLTLIERWREDDPQLRGPEIVPSCRRSAAARSETTDRVQRGADCTRSPARQKESSLRTSRRS